MSVALATLPPPSAALRLLEARVLPEFGAFWLMRPWLSAVTPPGDGHPVLVLPGLLADDSSTHALRSFLNSHGYAAFGWKLGRNLGMRANLERDMLARIHELFERYGQRRISLVGWSLGSYFEALGTVLAHEVLDFAAEHGGVSSPLKGGLAPWQQREVTTYIESHLSESIRLATLARLAGLSIYHFCRAFKQSLGLPPHQYHCQRRIEHAKHLLASTRQAVTEVGLTLGYSETSSFTAAFHRTTGMTPTAFRRSLPAPFVSDDPP
jgi:AraC-like DNA-binding protein